MFDAFKEEKPPGFMEDGQFDTGDANSQSEARAVKRMAGDR